MPNRGRLPQLRAEEALARLPLARPLETKGVRTMAKHLVLWKLDDSKTPMDPKERASAWKGLLQLVKQDFEKGLATAWGSFVGEGAGYGVYEGTELEVGLALQQYVPFVGFELHVFSTVDETMELVEAMM
jgi:hypothetical protein